MTYRLFKIIMNSAGRAYDNADGAGVDASTDPVITKDPNNYLAPRIDKMNVIQFLVIIALVLVTAYLSVQIAKTTKSFNV